MNNRLKKEKWSWLEKIIDFILTFLATLIGVLLAFYGANAISEDQKSAAVNQAQKQEVSSVVQLLELAQKDINRYLRFDSKSYKTG